MTVAETEECDRGTHFQEGLVPECDHCTDGWTSTGEHFPVQFSVVIVPADALFGVVTDLVVSFWYYGYICAGDVWHCGRTW